MFHLLNAFVGAGATLLSVADLRRRVGALGAVVGMRSEAGDEVPRHVASTGGAFSSVFSAVVSLVLKITSDTTPMSDIIATTTLHDITGF